MVHGLEAVLEVLEVLEVRRCWHSGHSWDAGRERESERLVVAKAPGAGARTTWGGGLDDKERT